MNMPQNNKFRAAAERRRHAASNPLAFQKDGILLGLYTPRHRNGMSLAQTFNVFAAPEDLPGGLKNYEDTLTAIAGLKDWHGFDGTSYLDSTQLCIDLETNVYSGGWIIPPFDILTGYNFKDNDPEALGDISMPDNLCARKDADGLEGTFSMAEDLIGHYWSFSPRQDISSSCTASISKAHTGEAYLCWLSKKKDQCHCRPVRLVRAR